MDKSLKHKILKNSCIAFSTRIDRSILSTTFIYRLIRLLSLFYTNSCLAFKNIYCDLNFSTNFARLCKIISNTKFKKILILILALKLTDQDFQLRLHIAWSDFENMYSELNFTINFEKLCKIIIAKCLIQKLKKIKLTDQYCQLRLNIA